MKPISIVGAVLIVLGVAVLAYGFTYTSRDTVLDIGPLHATADTERTIPPIAGIAAVAGGVALLVAGRRKTARGGA
jgi:uncharacterized membrane protein